MVGCSSEVEFLAKVHCIREASKVEIHYVKWAYGRVSHNYSN